MPLVTASGLQRALTCQLSLVLPQARNENVFARVGTEIHEYLAECLTRYRAKKGLGFEPPPTDGYTDKAKETIELIELERLQTMQPSLNPEVAYSYNLANKTVRVLGVNLGRRYGRTLPTEITGTIDVEGLYDGASYVADYKTGYSEIPHPTENAQLLFAALCSMKTRNTTRCVAEIIKIYPSGGLFTTSAVISRSDVEDFEERLNSLTWKVKKAKTGQGIPVESDQCRYCPSFAFCPAKVTLLRKLLELQDHESLADEQIANMADRLARAQEAINHLSQRLDGLIESKGEDGVTHSDGTTSRIVYEDGSEKLDAKTVLAVMVDRYGGEVAAKSITPVASKVSLRSALREVAEKGQLAQTEREVLAEIRKRGGVEKTVRRKLVRE